MRPALQRGPLALSVVLLFALAAFAVPSLASADSVTDQYKEDNWSPTGDSPQQKPNYQPGNGSNSGQPTQSGSVSNSPGTAGGAPETSGDDGDGGNGAAKQGGDGKAGSNGDGKSAGRGNSPGMTSELGDKTVAQVPDASVTSPSSTASEGGSSSLIWILIAVLALAGISGGIAMRMRAKQSP